MGMGIIVAIVLIGLCLLASCSPCNSPQNGNVPNTNANANSNANQAILGVATSPPSPVPSSTLDPNFKECNPYSSLIPGSEAGYSLTYWTGLQANAMVVVDQATEGGVPVFVQTTQIVDRSGGYNKNETSVQKYVCDKPRIKIIAENRDNTVEGYKTLLEMHYADPAHIMLEPAALKPWTTWSYSFTGDASIAQPFAGQLRSVNHGQLHRRGRGRGDGACRQIQSREGD